MADDIILTYGVGKQLTPYPLGKRLIKIRFNQIHPCKMDIFHGLNRQFTDAAECGFSVHIGNALPTGNLKSPLSHVWSLTKWFRQRQNPTWYRYPV